MAEYTNPNQKGGGGFDANSLIFTAVIFIVFFFGLQYFFPKHQTPDSQQTAQNTQQAVSPAASVAAP